MYVVACRVDHRKIRYVGFILSLSTRNICICLFYDSAIFYRYYYFNYDTKNRIGFINVYNYEIMTILRKHAAMLCETAMQSLSLMLIRDHVIKKSRIPRERDKSHLHPSTHYYRYNITLLQSFLQTNYDWNIIDSREIARK